MRRRRVLQTLGFATAVGIAGCTSSDDSSDAEGTDGGSGDDGNGMDNTDGTDGTGNGDETAAANEFGYETISESGVEVPLVPVADAIEWFRNDEVVFADARGQRQFSAAHVAGAVHSPAPDGLSENDPVEQHSTDTRIVTYCACPHHLSSMRASSLISDGYSHTYALDEGFAGRADAWLEQGYPVQGKETEQPDEYLIAGQTDATHAGEFAWAYHDPSGQREPNPIAEDGTFSISVRFYDVDEATPIRVETPAASVTRPLGELTETTLHL